MAGSTATMDHVFRVLVQQVGVSLVDAARLCSTTAARELALESVGAIAPGAMADLVLLDRQLSVVRTYVGGQLAWDGSAFKERV
jgi:N-acetylglucosamine-6-phosphate deacetylase